MDRKTQVIGRVAVGRALRFKPAQDAKEAAGPSAVVCKRCGRLLCDPARVRLFAGMTIRCVGCGEGTRV